MVKINTKKLYISAVFVVLISATLLITGCVSQDSMKEYQSEALGITFQYPESFEVNETVWDNCFS